MVINIILKSWFWRKVPMKVSMPVVHEDHQIDLRKMPENIDSGQELERHLQASWQRPDQANTSAEGKLGNR